MPRKKNAKRSKHQTTNNSIAKMHKEFLKTPAKLAKYMTKEVAAIESQESKLKKALNKLSIQLKKSEARIQTAKSKNTPAGKKQLKKAEKSYIKTLKLHDSLNRKLESVTKSLEKVTTEHSKLVALKKLLTQFEKEWIKNAKQAKPKAVKTKSNKKAKVKVLAAVPTQTESVALDNSENATEELIEKAS